LQYRLQKAVIDMCTAIFRDGILARTVDRDGLLSEHFTVVREDYAGGVIRGQWGEIWIDGLNKSGLKIALLNYRKELTEEIHGSDDGIETIHPARLIVHLLRSCADTKEACRMLASFRLSEDMPRMYPHYMIGDDSGRCIVYESGRIYDNTVGVLANAPSYPEQAELLSALTDSGKVCPWDHTSESRFCRAAWLRSHAELDSAEDCFALLDTLAVPKGMDPRKNYRTLLKTVMHNGMYSYEDEKSRTVKSVRIGECGSHPVTEALTIT